jgi:hypothetical protein
MKFRLPIGRLPHRWALALALAGATTAVLVITAYAATRGNPPATSKQAKLHQIAAQATAAANSWHGPKHPATPPASCPVQGVQSNINVDVLPGDPDHITNVATIAPAPGRPFVYQVYAGSAAGNAQQGILIVMRRDMDPCAPTAQGSTFTRFATPYQRGAVTLTAISGDTVSFTTAAGGSGHFNYITGQFS